MSAPSIEQAATTGVPPRLTAERRAEFLEKAKLLATEIGEVTPAGEVATAQEARRAAVWFVLMRVSNLVRVGGVEAAEWRDGERPVWAFPLSLTYPHKGDVGRVGEVLVDAKTCKVLDDPERVARIEADVSELARRTIG